MAKASPYLIKVIKRRIKILSNAVAANDRKISINAHKSRHVRLSGAGRLDNLRKALFVDKLRELEILLDYLQGRLSLQKYLDKQVNEIIG